LLVSARVNFSLAKLDHNKTRTIKPFCRRGKIQRDEVEWAEVHADDRTESWNSNQEWRDQVDDRESQRCESGSEHCQNGRR
jgi:hypothetical protein